MKDVVAVAKEALTASSDSTARIKVFEIAADKQHAFFDDQSKELAERCYQAQSEASDTRSRMQRESAALGGELSTLRSAATSLTHGVVKSLQIIGLLGRELEPPPARATDGQTRQQPMSARRTGVDVADLLEWEKTGHGLASRLEKEWQPFDAAGLPNLLTLLERKANEADVRMLRASIGSAPRMSPGLVDAGKPWLPRCEKPETPSTSAGGDFDRGASALSDRVCDRGASALSVFTRGSACSPSPPPKADSPVPRRPNSSGRVVTA